MPKILYTHDYNRQDYDPPMPVLALGLSRAGRTEAAVTIEAIVDSGSDGTLIPLDILEEAGAQYVDSAYVRGITGHREEVELYLITVHIGGHSVHAVRAAALPASEEAILGRNVLNQLNITLNGAAGVTEVLE